MQISVAVLYPSFALDSHMLAQDRIFLLVVVRPFASHSSILLSLPSPLPFSFPFRFVAGRRPLLCPLLRIRRQLPADVHTT